MPNRINSNNNISGITSMFVGMALSEMNRQEEQRELWKNRIAVEWENSKNLPRKKKKQVRKELKLDLRFVDFDPFDPLGLF